MGEGVTMFDQELFDENVAKFQRVFQDMQEQMAAPSTALELAIRNNPGDKMLLNFQKLLMLVGSALADCGVALKTMQEGVHEKLEEIRQFESSAEEW